MRWRLPRASVARCEAKQPDAQLLYDDWDMQSDSNRPVHHSRAGKLTATMTAHGSSDWALVCSIALNVVDTDRHDFCGGSEYAHSSSADSCWCRTGIDSEL